MKTVRNLAVDLSNITYIAYYANKNEFTKSLLIHKLIENIFYVSREYKVDGIVIACDSPNVWRKDIYPIYKANRDSKRDENYEEIKETMILVSEFFNECTSIPSVSVERCEADDIIYALAKKSEQLNQELVILSNDGDFFQLCSDNVTLHSPRKGKGKVDYDVTNQDFDLFMKCIRGDAGDNILSAYSGVRKTKLEAAWNDNGSMIELMKHTRPDGKLVESVYKLNRELIDLSKQPQKITESIEAKILSMSGNSDNYDYVECLRFLGRHDLITLSKNIEKYSKMFEKGANFNINT